MPHVPLHVSDKFKGKSARGLYGDVIMEIDWSVGEILAALKKHGLDENTLVIFTSDNGPVAAVRQPRRHRRAVARGQSHDVRRRRARAVHRALAGQNSRRAGLP